MKQIFLFTFNSHFFFFLPDINFQNFTKFQQKVDIKWHTIKIDKNISLYLGSSWSVSCKSHEKCILGNLSICFRPSTSVGIWMLILLPLLISYTNAKLILLPLLIWKINLSANASRVWSETYGENTCCSSASMKSYEVEVKNVSLVREEKVKEKFVPVSNIFQS